MNPIHHIIEVILPYVITFIEIIGVLIIIWSVIKGLWQYIQNTFMHKNLNLQLNLSKGLATALEFKLAAEILKTVLVQTLDELYLLGAIVLLRAIMSILIHFEMKSDHDDNNGKKFFARIKQSSKEESESSDHSIEK